MPNTELAHVFVNFSKRKIKIVDNEGYDKEVQWKWDFEGAAGFAETISELGHILDPEMVTYLFAEQ
jgi:hypothetical protein|tara:strand:+ start:1672 stop:1869 length:198 start_codon:yes stop_codon:yes gene_type:complete